MLPGIQNIVTDFDNPILQRYIKREMSYSHKCPECKAPFESYTDLYHHICNNHEDIYTTPTIQNALNPVYNVRKTFNRIENPELVTIGKFFGEKITSIHNQMALLNIYGPMGMGKSNAAMHIGIKTSEYVAHVKGGEPKKYFNVENVAIMKLDSIIPIIEDMKNRQYSVIILDDIGASYSARDFNSVVNKNLNKIFQTFRDTNCLVILSTVSKFMIDKLARRIAHFQLEMIESRFDEGIAVGKLLQIQDQNRDGGRQHFKYIVYNGVKYTRCVFPRAEGWIVDQYEIKRKAIRETLANEAISNIHDSVNEMNEKAGKVQEDEKIPKHIRLVDEILMMLQVNPKITDSKLAINLKTSRNTIIKAKKYMKDNSVF